MEKTNQSLTGYSKSRGINYVRLHLAKYSLLLNTYVSRDLNAFQKMLIGTDFITSVILYGAGINDYFQYQFFEKSISERKKFIVARKWKKIIRRCNGKIAQDNFDDKSVFNRIYNDFLGRDWIDMDTVSIGEFQQFGTKHPESLSKIKNGSGGNGIELFHYDKTTSEDDWKRLKKEHCILEEKIEQNHELKEFNPSSVNTIRVVTITNGSNIHVMNAVLKIGNGDGCTDNFHHYGLAALVDCETGIVITPAVDKKNGKYVSHPISGKEILGYQIPFWDRIINTVKRIALIDPAIRYVGWDVALNDKGEVCVIEGNCASDPDITQIPDQIGKWPAYNAVLKELQ